MNKFFIQDNMWSSYTSYILLSTASLGPHHGSGHHHRHPDQGLDSCCPMKRRELPWRKVLLMFFTMVATWQQEDPHLDSTPTSNLAILIQHQANIHNQAE